MPRISRVPKHKQPVRRHFIGEWLEERGMTPVDLLDALNDPERQMGSKDTDKSQIYRWLKGQMPNPKTQKRIAAALKLKDASSLLRPPADDWIARFMESRPLDERNRARHLLETAFPDQDDL